MSVKSGIQFSVRKGQSLNEMKGKGNTETWKRTELEQPGSCFKFLRSSGQTHHEDEVPPNHILNAGRDNGEIPTEGTKRMHRKNQEFGTAVEPNRTRRPTLLGKLFATKQSADVAFSRRTGRSSEEISRKLAEVCGSETWGSDATSETWGTDTMSESVTRSDATSCCRFAQRRVFRNYGAATAHLKDVSMQVKAVAEVVGDLDGFKQNPRVHMALIAKANQQIEQFQTQVEGAEYHGEDGHVQFNDLKKEIMQQLTELTIET